MRSDPYRWYHGRPKCDPSTGSSWLKSRSSVYSRNFSMKSIVIDPFMYQNTVSISFFIKRWARHFFFTWESLCFHYMNCFSTRVLCGKSTFIQFFFLFLFIHLLFFLFFLIKHAISTHHRFFWKFQMVCSSQTPNVLWQPSVQAWSHSLILSNFEWTQ